jgi:hypothetical protein
MMKLVRALAITSILMLSGILSAQDGCKPALNNSIAGQNYDLLFIASTHTAQQIWRYNFGKQAAVDTKLRIPDDAFQLTLDSGANQLAYGIIKHDPISNKDTLKIDTLNLNTGENVEVHAGKPPELPQIIDLRWLGNNRVGFISNGREQQYTIVDVQNGSSITYHSEIPILPKTNVSESVLGDWDIQYSPNFTRAAFIDFRNSDNTITFWNLDARQQIKTDLELPVRWVDAKGAFEWINEDQFLILNAESNWLEGSLESNALRQITDIREDYRLRVPVIAPKQQLIAFQVFDSDSNNFTSSIGVWNGKALIKSCLSKDSGQYLMNSRGWDKSSRYFAFTVYDYVADETHIYVFDTQTAILSNIYSSNRADPKAVVLGWVEAR